ncbi:hypothetical protein [Promicromonospora soli]
MAKPVTNHHLHTLLEEAGYAQSRAAFARQVNLRGSAHGLSLGYDASSVYWWLRGRRPLDPVPQVIAEVLARRLGRPVRTGELGLGGTRPPEDGSASYAFDLTDARNTVTASWRRMAGGDESLAGLPFVPDMTTEAGWRWHFDPPDTDASHRGHRQVTEGDVEALRACQEQFLGLDRQHGGGRFRSFLAQWLHHEVDPLLHGTYTDKVGRQLFAAVAELTGQLAFMSYDAGDHGLAQRHFVQALRLAKAGDHTGFGAHVLANMSTQAVYLGQSREAVRLARAAVDSGRAHPAQLARLHTAEASAHAVAGDARACMTALGAAERALDRVEDVGGRLPWAGYFTPAHLAGTAIRCLRDLGRVKDALGLAEQALDLQAGSVRTRALHTALIATVHLAGPAPDPEQAGHLAREGLALAGRVRSGRVTDRIGELARRLSVYSGNEAVDGFLHEAREHLTGPA